MMLLWIALIGCATRKEVAALEAELAALRAEHEALKAEVAALQRPAPAPANATPKPLSRAALDAVLEDPEALGRLGRVVPHTDDSGEVDGFRVLGIRRGSLLEQIGLRNGDVLHAINSQPLTSVGDALAAYANLKSATRFEVALTRRGQPLTLTVTVTD